MPVWWHDLHWVLPLGSDALTRLAHVEWRITLEGCDPRLDLLPIGNQDDAGADR